MLLSSKNINMRTVDLDTTTFIYKMRQSQTKTKFLSSVRGNFIYRLFDRGYFTPCGMNVLIYAV